MFFYDISVTNDSTDIYGVVLESRGLDLFIDVLIVRSTDYYIIRVLITSTVLEISMHYSLDYPAII